MGEDWNTQVQSYMCNGLALGLVDGHCKSKTNGELTVGKRNVEVIIGRLDIHSGNEDNVSCKFASQDAALQHVLFYIHQDHVSAIAKTLRRVNVSQKHEGAARF